MAVNGIRHKVYGIRYKKPKNHYPVNRIPLITPATKYINVVIPAKAGIQAGTGCRIKSGMTE